MSEVVSRVLAEIPGWEDAAFTRLEGSVTNVCWLIDDGDRQALLKIDDAPRGAPFSPRPFEAEVQARAMRRGLANSVIYVSDTVLLTEYVAGQTWSDGSLDDNENLAQLAAAMRTLHALPLTGRTFDAISAAHQYATCIDDDQIATTRDCVAKVEAMPQPHNLCCCHNDLVAANIICTPEVRFLDWEYACDNDPFFDIATIVAHHRLPPERANFLLDAYFDGDGARWRQQLRRQAEFYDALHWLWAAARSPAIA